MPTDFAIVQALPSRHPRPRAGGHQGGWGWGGGSGARQAQQRGWGQRGLAQARPRRRLEQGARRCAAASACPTPSVRRAKVGEVLCCSHLPPMALLRHRTPSWRSVAVPLALAVALGSRAVVAQHWEVCSSTGGVLPALERWHARMNAARDATLRSRCPESHQACCVLPGPQCAANCWDCTTAGPGKCDRCADGYGPSKNGTCAPVRLLQSSGGRCCLHVHDAPLRVCCCESHQA